MFWITHHTHVLVCRSIMFPPVRAGSGPPRRPSAVKQRLQEPQARSPPDWHLAPGTIVSDDGLSRWLSLEWSRYCKSVRAVLFQASSGPLLSIHMVRLPVNPGSPLPSIRRSAYARA